MVTLAGLVDEPMPFACTTGDGLMVALGAVLLGCVKKLKPVGCTIGESDAGARIRLSPGNEATKLLAPSCATALTPPLRTLEIVTLTWGGSKPGVAEPMVLTPFLIVTWAAVEGTNWNPMP